MCGRAGTVTLPVMRDGVVLAIGTAKGAFVLTGGQLSAPLFPGEHVPALAIDTRRVTPRLLAGTVSSHWGPVVRSSDDEGRTWTDPAVRPMRFPRGVDAALGQVWQLAPSTPEEPDTVYAGVEPAALFRSEDRGDTWTLVGGLWDHEDRPAWTPGFGGLGLHTVLVDPRDADRLLVAISAGGVYRSVDRGETWAAANRGIRAADRPDAFPTFGQCVHKVARDPTDPDRLYAQNHFGVYRTDDGGDAWVDVSGDLPSNFGFPIVAHPRAADTAYVIPLESDVCRWTPEGRCRVYRTVDAGASWVASEAGLPHPRAYLTVLRDAFVAGDTDTASLYFGTRTGQVFESSDDGESWRLLVEHLPPVLCVRSATLG